MDVTSLFDNSSELATTRIVTSPARPSGSSRAAAGPMDESTQIIFAKLRKEQEALENYKEAIRQKPHEPAAYLQMGKLYLELHLPAKAMDFLKHALRMKASGVVLTRLMGNLLYKYIRQEKSERRQQHRSHAFC